MFSLAALQTPKVMFWNIRTLEPHARTHLAMALSTGQVFSTIAISTDGGLRADLQLMARCHAARVYSSALLQ